MPSLPLVCIQHVIRETLWWGYVCGGFAFGGAALGVTVSSGSAFSNDAFVGPSGETLYSGAAVSGAAFSGAAVSWAAFSGAAVSWAAFSGAAVSWAVFSGVPFSRAVSPYQSVNNCCSSGNEATLTSVISGHKNCFSTSMCTVEMPAFRPASRSNR